MSKVKINTDLVSDLAGKISNGNNEIQTAFDAVISSVNGLGNSWSGAAYGHASASFGSIREKYYHARYNSVNNYANTLRNQMVKGYTEAETSNIRLADQFK